MPDPRGRQNKKPLVSRLTQYLPNLKLKLNLNHLLTDPTPRSKLSLTALSILGNQDTRESIQLLKLMKQHEGDMRQLAADFQTKLQQNDTDRSLSPSQQTRALKNVALMSLTQMLFGSKVELTDAMYAYTLAYPYTDDIIDNPNTSPEQKKAFGKNISQALMQGTPKEQLTAVFNARSSDATERKYAAYEQRVYELIATILASKPDAQARQEMAQAINGVNLTQVASAQQIDRSAQTPQQLHDNIMQLSPQQLRDNFRLIARKGASAPHATAHILNPSSQPLTEDASKFFAFTGAVIQLFDDMNDTHKDLNEKIVTPANIEYIKKGNVDDYALKTLQLLDDAQKHIKRDYPSIPAKTGKLMLQALKLKTLSVMADPQKKEAQQRLFSDALVEQAKQWLPFNVHELYSQGFKNLIQSAQPPKPRLNTSA